MEHMILQLIYMCLNCRYYFVVVLVSNLVAIELGNWKQTQRMFSWEDDRGKSELSNIQQW